MSNNINKKTQITLISSLILSLVLHSFTSVVDAQPIPIKKPIRLGFDLWAPDLLTYVAQEKGYFKKIM